jgi:ABC-type branched-subunit amino acid transport system substrate-binding protein
LFEHFILSLFEFLFSSLQVDDLVSLWRTATTLGMTTAPYVWINPSPDPHLVEDEFVGLIAAAPYVNRSTPEYLKFAGLWQALYERDTRLTYNLSQPGTWSAWWYDGVWASAHAMKSMMMQGWNFSSTDEKYKSSLRMALNRTMYQVCVTLLIVFLISFLHLP